MGISTRGQGKANVPRQISGCFSCGRRIAPGADKAYDSKDFVEVARKLNFTLHVTKNENERRSNLDCAGITVSAIK
jgi:hypothetical protein